MAVIPLITVMAAIAISFFIWVVMAIVSVLNRLAVIAIRIIMALIDVISSLAVMVIIA